MVPAASILVIIAITGVLSEQCCMKVNNSTKQMIDPSGKFSRPLQIITLNALFRVGRSRLFHGVNVVSSLSHSLQHFAVIVRPLQINSLFPVLNSSIFACGRAVHFHYFIIRLAAFQAIICLAMAGITIKSCIKACLSLFLPF